MDALGVATREWLSALRCRTCGETPVGAPHAGREGGVGISDVADALEIRVRCHARASVTVPWRALEAGQMDAIKDALSAAGFGALE